MILKVSISVIVGILIFKFLYSTIDFIFDCINTQNSNDNKNEK